MRKNLIASALAVALGGMSIAAHADVNTVVGGTMFVDFTNIDQTSKGKDTAAAGTGLDVKRFYLTVDHKFDDFWSANLTTDFNYQSTLSQTSLFVKKAYLQAKWSSELAVRVGADDQPWIGFVDGLSGLRYVENSLVDRLSNYGNSADWGIHVLGNAEDNFWNYNFGVVNGGGFRNPTRSSTVDFEGRIGIQPIKGLMLAVGGYSGEFGKDVETNNQQTPVVHTRSYTRGDALIAYNTSKTAVIGFTRTLAAEWGRYGINVNAICPGFFMTKMAAGLIETIGEEKMAAAAPLGRLGDDDDLKGIALLYASQAGKHITGQWLAVDGGVSVVLGAA